MNNFKNGAGNLDFGGDDDDEPREQTDETTTVDAPASERESEAGTDAPGPLEGEPPDPELDQSSRHTPETESEYPYLVRRNNVMDERETRWELYLREEVADRESSFRQTLAERLETDTVSKTDAREFAIKFAFEHPEKVAELMEDEGYGAVE